MIADLLGLTENKLCDFMAYLVSLHDIGKIEYHFQCKDPVMAAKLKDLGVDKSYIGKVYTRHEKTGERALCSIWEQQDQDYDASEIFSVLIGAHHQKNQSTSQLGKDPYFEKYRQMLEDFMRRRFVPGQKLSLPELPDKQEGTFEAVLLGMMMDRKSTQVLYRTNMVQNKLCIYMYAESPAERIPDNCVVQQRDITAWLDTMEVGQLWNFDLITSPTKKVASEGKKNSQRRILRQPQERREWLERKSEQNGFTIVQVQEQEQLHVSGRHKTDKGGAMYHDAYHYQGVLQITEAESFRKALQCGIGSGKAYGFGMMMVKYL